MGYRLGLIRVDDLLYPPPTRPLGLLPDPYLNHASYLIPIAPKSLKNHEFERKGSNFLSHKEHLKVLVQNILDSKWRVCVFRYVSLYIGLIETDKWTTTQEFPFTKGTVEWWKSNKCFPTDTSNGHDFILELCQQSFYKNGLCQTFLSFINVKRCFPITYFMSFSCTDCGKKLQLICTLVFFLQNCHCCSVKNCGTIDLIGWLTLINYWFP